MFELVVLLILVLVLVLVPVFIMEDPVALCKIEEAVCRDDLADADIVIAAFETIILKIGNLN